MSGSSSTIKTRSMPNILASYQKNNHLGDVGRVVPHSLEVLCNEDEFYRPRDGAGVFEHVCEQFAKDLFVKGVHEPVIVNHSLSKFGIRIHECVQALLQDLLRRFGHYSKIDQTLQFGLLDQLDRAFRNIDPDIADALNVLYDFESGSNKSQVARDWLLEREDLETQVIDFNFECVEFVIAFDHVFRE